MLNVIISIPSGDTFEIQFVLCTSEVKGVITMTMSELAILISILSPLILVGIGYGIMSNQIKNNKEYISSVDTKTSKDFEEMKLHCYNKHSAVDGNMTSMLKSVQDLRELVIDRMARIETAIGNMKSDKVDESMERLFKKFGINLNQD